VVVVVVVIVVEVVVVSGTQVVGPIELPATEAKGLSKASPRHALQQRCGVYAK